MKFRTAAFGNAKLRGIFKLEKLIFHKRNHQENLRTAAFGNAKKLYFSPDAVDVAVNICLQVWHSPAPVDQEQTNTEMVARVKDNFEDREKPEDDFEDGPGEVAPEADVAEAEGLHDLVQVLHVLPVSIHHDSVSVSCRTTFSKRQQRQRQTCSYFQHLHAAANLRRATRRTA